MEMDVGMGGFFEPIEILEDMTATTPDVCVKQTHPNVICSDGNKDQSKCRRIDCKSTESRCICYEGQCSYDRGEPECMSEKLLAPGCEENKGNGYINR
jgi:hypothetical protein